MNSEANGIYYDVPLATTGPYIVVMAKIGREPKLIQLKDWPAVQAYLEARSVESDWTATITMLMGYAQARPFSF